MIKITLPNGAVKEFDAASVTGRQVGPRDPRRGQTAFAQASAAAHLHLDLTLTRANPFRRGHVRLSLGPRR